MKEPFGHRISHLRPGITGRGNERRHSCMPAEPRIWLPRAEVLTYKQTLRTVWVGASLAAGFWQVKLNCVPMRGRHAGAGAGVGSSASGSANPDDDDDDDEEEEDDDDDGNGDDDGDCANRLPALLDFAHDRGCLLSAARHRVHARHHA